MEINRIKYVRFLLKCFSLSHFICDFKFFYVIFFSKKNIKKYRIKCVINYLFFLKYFLLNLCQISLYIQHSIVITIEESELNLIQKLRFLSYIFTYIKYFFFQDMNL